MIDLNNLEEIKKLDPKDVYGSTGMFINQCRQIHELVEKAELPDRLLKSDPGSVVFSGMGGSAYGGHVCLSLFKDEIEIPMFLNSDYGLPKFVNSDTLVILTSYSGGTEETLSSMELAKSIGANKIALTTGGKLAELAGNDSIVFDPKFNPSGQPRLGTGYIVLGTIEILRRIGLLKHSSEDVVNAIDEVEKNIEQIKSEAMELSKKIIGCIPVIFAGSIFEGNAHILRNQFNETAKSFSSFHYIPEANHHVMEGLKNPEGRKLVSLFLDSEIYDAKIKKRMELTKDVVRQNNTEVLSYKIKGQTKLSQSLELLAFGGYLTLYTGLLYGQDPSLIPWVDYFKEKLSKG